MHENPTTSHYQPTELWDTLTNDFLGRLASHSSREAIEQSIAAMHLTAHLVCRFVGNCHAVLRPTMTLKELANTLQREITPVSRQLDTVVAIETFGTTEDTVADSRWLLALWSLIIDAITSADKKTKVEVVVGACGKGYEIEVGHDDQHSTATTDYFESSLTCRWLHSICPEWTLTTPACPLGGGAVQINIPTVQATGLRRAA
jgi:hypothetical protein